ncbi:glycosyltransferase [Microbacterium sp. YY-03]|uniref:glycosyltransferase n=1 Tax=Microbacterium sp. YY-03 TaxID=3421636 RepID=UPI003D180D1A
MSEGTLSDTVSVCVATYNGGKYVKHQLTSILDQLGPDDEIIIVDDASTDDTVAIIERMGEPRISVTRNVSNLGYVRTFERAVSLARGDIVFLSDQDDEWMSGRVGAMCAAHQRGAVVAGNLVLLGNDAPLPHPITRRPWYLTRPSSRHTVRNRIKVLGGVAPYFGCAMSIRREFLDVILPFPERLTESHDLWIAIAANTAGEMVHLGTPVIRRRLHDSNASPSRPRGPAAVLRARLMLVGICMDAIVRVRRIRRR